MVLLDTRAALPDLTLADRSRVGRITSKGRSEIKPSRRLCYGNIETGRQMADPADEEAFANARTVERAAEHSVLCR